MEFDKLDFNASHLAQILGPKLDEGPNKSTLSWFNNKLLKFDFFVALSSSEMNHKIPSTKPLIINYDSFYTLFYLNVKMNFFSHVGWQEVIGSELT